MKKLSDKALDRLVEQAYYRTCSGVQIDIMDIGKVFKVGKAAILAGADKAGLEKAVFEYVQTIRADKAEQAGWANG